MSKYVPKQFSPRIYPEWGELLDDLTIEKQAEIFNAIIKYPNENPTGGVWKFIKSQIDKDYNEFIERANKNKEIVKNYWKSKANEGKRTLTNDNDGEPITYNINNKHKHKYIINNIIDDINVKNGKYKIDDNFKINSIKDYEIYKKEVGENILKDVQEWIIKKKSGKTLDELFICQQIINFSKRNGII